MTIEQKKELLTARLNKLKNREVNTKSTGVVRKICRQLQTLGLDK